MDTNKFFLIICILIFIVVCVFFNLIEKFTDFIVRIWWRRKEKKLEKIAEANRQKALRDWEIKEKNLQKKTI